MLSTNEQRVLRALRNGAETWRDLRAATRLPAKEVRRVALVLRELGRVTWKPYGSLVLVKEAA